MWRSVSSPVACRPIVPAGAQRQGLIPQAVALLEQDQPLARQRIQVLASAPGVPGGCSRTSGSKNSGRAFTPGPLTGSDSSAASSAPDLSSSISRTVRASCSTLENGARTQKLRVYEMTDNPPAWHMLGYLFVRRRRPCPCPCPCLCVATCNHPRDA
jgi:hypothetical protein